MKLPRYKIDTLSEEKTCCIRADARIILGLIALQSTKLSKYSGHVLLFFADGKVGMHIIATRLVNHYIHNNLPDDLAIFTVWNHLYFKQQQCSSMYLLD